MAVGGRAQAHAVHKAGPSGLCCSATSWCYVAQYPLDARWTQAVDHGALPANGLSAALHAYSQIKITNLVKSGGLQLSRVQVEEHVELSVSSDREQQPMPPPSPQAISPELPVDQAKHHPGMPASCAISHQLNQCFSRPPPSRIMIPQLWTSRTSSRSLQQRRLVHPYAHIIILVFKDIMQLNLLRVFRSQITSTCIN